MSKTSKFKIHEVLYNILIDLFLNLIQKWEWDELTLPKPGMLRLECVVIEKISDIIKLEDIQKYLKISGSAWNAITLNMRKKKFKKHMRKIIKDYFNIELTEINEAPHLIVMAMRFLNAGFRNECLKIVERFRQIFNNHSVQKEWIELIEILAHSYLDEDVLSKLEKIKKQTNDPEIYINAWQNLCKFKRENIADERIVLINKWQRCQIKYRPI